MQKKLFDLDKPLAYGRSWFGDVLASLSVCEEPAWPDKFGLTIREWITRHNCHPIKTLSLFSGGGGLDIAFHDVGFDIFRMIEVEPKYVETLMANSQEGKLLEGSKVLCMDIRDYEPERGLSIDFIIGGPPCQTFSAAGRRAAGVLGTTDPRGNLFAEYVRLLKRLQPIGFLFENVYGITGAQNGLAWKEIQGAFKNVGYTIHHRVLDAADYGVPQHRERLFIVGVKEGDYLFPCPTHGPDSIGEHPFYQASAAVRGVDVSTASEGLGGRYGHLLADIPPGLNYSFYTKEMGHPFPVFSWRSKFSDFLYKADPDSPVRTVKAQGGQYTGPFSWENRPFTVAELKRLQTIPDNYDVVGGRQVAIEQIGNSVPPQIGRVLALSILDQILRIKLPFQMRYLPQEKKLRFRQRKRLLTHLYATKAKMAIQHLYEKEATTQSQIVESTEKEGVRFLSPDFSWRVAQKGESSAINLRYKLTSKSWDICAGSHTNLDNQVAYRIKITPSVKNDWCLNERYVMLRAMDFDIRTFTGLWKALEEEISEAYSIADLVQLSGYYQYKPKISASLEFAQNPESDNLWRVIQAVVKGVGVGEQIPLYKLALIWDTDASDVFSYLRILRTIGYEVRGHSTNPQIAKGEYLIPYIFPTLTPRSVQLRKRLDDEEGEARSERRAALKSIF